MITNFEKRPDVREGWFRYDCVVNGFAFGFLKFNKDMNEAELEEEVLKILVIQEQAEAERQAAISALQEQIDYLTSLG